MKAAIICIVFAVLFLAGCTVGKAELQQAFPPPGSAQAGERIEIIGGERATPACADYDDTISYGDDTYYTSGFVITGGPGVPREVDHDRCNEDELIEYLCEFGHKKHITVACPYGCFDGACQGDGYEGRVVEFPNPPSAAPVVYG